MSREQRHPPHRTKAPAKRRGQGRFVAERLPYWRLNNKDESKLRVIAEQHHVSMSDALRLLIDKEHDALTKPVPGQSATAPAEPRCIVCGGRGMVVVPGQIEEEPCLRCASSVVAATDPGLFITKEMTRTMTPSETNPCGEPAHNGPCVLEKNHYGFVGHWSAENLEREKHWPCVRDEAPCKDAKCPAVKGARS